MIVNNFATAILIRSSFPDTSAIGTKLMAGGPSGISIMLNHNTPSASKKFVFLASAYITGIETAVQKIYRITKTKRTAGQGVQPASASPLFCFRNEDESFT